MNRREPVFRVKKLDLIIALLAAHLSLDFVNPDLVGANGPARVAVVAIVGVVVLILSTAWAARET